jgi:hypothetical protein
MATVPNWLRSIRPKRAAPWSCHKLMEWMEGPREQSLNCPNPPSDRGTVRRHSCPTARGPQTRPMRTEGIAVFARRMVLRSSCPCVRPAAILPVDVAFRPHGGRAAIPLPGSPLSWSRAVLGCMPAGKEFLRATAVFHDLARGPRG